MSLLGLIPTILQHEYVNIINYLHDKNYVIKDCNISDDYTGVRMILYKQHKNLVMVWREKYQRLEWIGV